VFTSSTWDPKFDASRRALRPGWFTSTADMVSPHNLKKVCDVKCSIHGRPTIGDITTLEKRIPTSRNPNQNRVALWQIFHHRNVRQLIGREDSMQSEIGTSRRLDSF
jgi:hypothetical protein